MSKPPRRAAEDPVRDLSLPRVSGLRGLGTTWGAPREAHRTSGDGLPTSEAHCHLYHMCYLSTSMCELN